MTDTNGWHSRSDELSAYIEGSAPALAVVSIEAHLLACAQCRAALSTLRRSAVPSVGSTTQGEQMWNRIAGLVDRPQRRARFSNRILEVSLASPALLATTIGVAAVLFLAVGITAAAKPHWSFPALLAFAPLAPVVASVAAFQPGIDPAGRLAEATPLAGTRLALLRSLLASFIALGSGIVASVLSSLPFDLVAMCLLPGVAFAAVVLAVATRSNPNRVATVLVTGWVTLIFGWTRRQRTTPTVETFREFVGSSELFGWALIGVTVAALLICYRRRHVIPGWRVR